MKNFWDEYLIPTSEEEALEYLEAFEGEAPILAGGTDLLVDFELTHQHVPAVIEITRIPEMGQVSAHDGELSIGATTTLSALERSKNLQRAAPHLVEAIKSIGSVQVRNMATLVGNVATASPAADGVPPLLTLDAQVEISGANGHRVIPLLSFLLGPRETDCGPEELIVGLRFPIPNERTACGFKKLGLRRAMAIAVVNLAILITMVNGKVERARIALGSVAPTAVRAQEAEERLVGTKLDDESLLEASELAVKATSPIDDFRATAAYREKMIRTLTRRYLERVRDQLKGNVE